MKTPSSHDATGGFGEQLNLIELPPFSPKYPNRSTLAGQALQLFLKGQTLTHPQFEDLTGSWRLSEAIRALRHDFGWPIETIEIPAPTSDTPNRVIAKYKMPQWVIELHEVSS